mmetsp:Transcript_35935/g.112389  ORF Transcript_35935/g.112389 Transcript_35935/m.112389 type:complete len:281 (+) Transcript_35935:86-928(+)
MLRVLQQLVDDARVGDGADVSELRHVRHPGGDPPQDPAHDFAASRLWQGRGELNLVGGSKGSNLRPHNLLQRLLDLRRHLISLLEGNERVDRLSFDRVGKPDDRRFHTMLELRESAFQLRRSNTMPGHVDDVIDAAGDAVVTVLVAPARIARDVLVLGDHLVGPVEELEVSLLEPFLVSVDAAQLARPGSLDRKIPSASAILFLAVRVQNGRFDTEEGLGSEARLLGSCSRQRCDHVTASLRLPPGVGDRALASSDMLAVPSPCLRVDGLADTPQDSERL